MLFYETKHEVTALPTLPFDLYILQVFTFIVVNPNNKTAPEGFVVVWFAKKSAIICHAMPHEKQEMDQSNIKKVRNGMCSNI